jgi:ribosomal protein S18 acetylase RimI-like enzyme
VPVCEAKLPTPLLECDASKISRSYERNFAGWFAQQTAVFGGTVDRTHGMTWVLDARPTGSSSLHRVRLKAADALDRIECVTKGSAAYGLAIGTFVTDQASPGNAERLFKQAGFRLFKRYDVLCLDLSTASMPESHFQIDTMQDYSYFNRMHPHPYLGRITTPYRREAIMQCQANADRRPRRTWEFMARVDDQPVGVANVFFNGGIAGIYNVGTVEAMRRQGIGTAVTRHALGFARECGYRFAVLTATAEGEPLYRGLGFEPVGTMSYLYLSKSKVAARA